MQAKLDEGITRIMLLNTKAGTAFRRSTYVRCNRGVEFINSNTTTPTTDVIKELEKKEWSFSALCLHWKVRFTWYPMDC
jgi:hypothetical protein